MRIDRGRVSTTAAATARGEREQQERDGAARYCAETVTVPLKPWTVHL
jgi:hypothetical protein